MTPFYGWKTKRSATTWPTGCGVYTARRTTSRNFLPCILVCFLHPAAFSCTPAFFDLTGLSGGRHWIDLTRGMDITDLFEVHHLNVDKACAVLPKFYVKVRVNMLSLSLNRAR